MTVVQDSCPLTIQGVTGNAFLALINTLLLSKCSLNSTESSYQENYGPLLKDGDVFDFIVVGAGAAGSVVANRLSENTKWKVLVLEAGGYPTLDSEVPAFYLNLISTEADWKYEAAPSKNICLGFKNGMCGLPRGKVLGGTSSINGMMYVRGYCGLYDEWEKLGNPGWNCKNATHYFIKSENVQKEELKNNPNHGTKGYLKTTPVTGAPNIKKILFNAAKQAGIKIGNDEIHDGIYESLMMTENGRRCSSAKAFLSTVKQRKNLLVATKSFTTKLVIKNKKITGVIIEVANKTITLKPRLEVILSAGTISTPQILQLSGIGPKTILKKPIINLPVGRNLHDHIINYGLVIKLKPLENKTEADLLDIAYEYLAKSKGPLSTLGSTNIHYFYNTKNLSVPEIQSNFNYIPKYNPEDLVTYLSKFAFNDISKESIISAGKTHDLIIASIILLTPVARGEIKIKSKNPQDEPIIELGMFEDDTDLETMIDAVENIRTFLKTDEFRKYDAQFLHYDIPNCRVVDFDTRDYWRCLFRNFCSSMYHSVGTCKMGAKIDKSTVVNPRLKVHGVDNLRVIDLSVAPIAPKGNPTAAAIMIGEKGADLIKEDLGFVQKK